MPTDSSTGRGVGRTLRRAVLRHALLTTAVAGLLAVVMIVVVWLASEYDGHRMAQLTSTKVAGALIADLATTDFSGAAPLDRAKLMTDVTPYLDARLVLRVKVWRVEPAGARIVFSDEQRLEGELHDFDAELGRRIDAGEPVSLRLPDDAEHRFENASGVSLIEVYIAFRDAVGTPMRLEIYVPVDTVAETLNLAGWLVPALLAALAALGAATVPITLSFARRLLREQEGRRAAVRYGLAASDRQRRELAQLLHDGVIQDLAGAGVVLDAIRRSWDAPDGSRPRLLLEKVQGLVVDDVRQLRSLATGFLPVGFDAGNLRAALVELGEQVDPDRRAVIEVSVDLDDLRTVDHERAGLVYRVARELLRNAHQHSGAAVIRVGVTHTASGLELVVADDGAGFTAADPGSDGHLGLKLVRSALEDAGGRLELRTSPGAGTTATAVLADPVPPERRSRLRRRADPVG